MTRLLTLLALGAGALYLLDQSGTVQISSGGSKAGGSFSGYTNSSAPAISGIKKAAGG